MNGRLLIDHSAWSRLGGPSLSQDRAEELASAVREGRIVVCLPFLLEAGYSAQSGADHFSRLNELQTMPRVGIDASVEDQALDAQRDLARSGHHRLPPPDLIVAALADRHGLGVLHYDRHFDTISEHTDLRFDSIWLAPRGSLDKGS